MLTTVELPDPIEHDTVPLAHFSFAMKQTKKLKFEFTKWWNDELEGNGPALQYLKIHSVSFGAENKFSAANTLQPAFCDSMDIGLLGYPQVGAANYWLSDLENGKNKFQIDLGCILEVQLIKLRNTHNSAYNTLSGRRIFAHVHKWNKETQKNEITKEFFDSAINKVDN